jgi:5-methylcytosine-specific restriction endonuclease McrA
MATMDGDEPEPTGYDGFGAPLYDHHPPTRNSNRHPFKENPVPYTPAPRCSDPQCGEMGVYGGRCATHKRKAWASPSQHTLQMDNSLKYVWRKQVMTDPNTGTTKTCEHCREATARIADHIIPIAEGGAKYDPANGQALCEDCDEAKTRTDLHRMALARKAARQPSRG